MSAAAERTDTATGRVSIDRVQDLVEDIIRQAYTEADAHGEDRVGRPKLVTLVRQRLPEYKISEHQVRKAKELVDAEDASPPAPPASEAPAVASDPAADSDRPLVLWPVNTSQRLAETNQRIAETLESAETPAPASQTPPARQVRASLASRLRQHPWALILMGIGAGFSVWSGWVGLGQMCGFGPVQPLPGIWDSLTINSAIVLPISVEAYGTYALRRWLSPGASRRTSIYAGVSAIFSLLVGGAAQVAYHELKAAGYSHAPWQVVMAVALVPVVVLALASILAKLVATDRQAGAGQ
jgi:hypothetical protein